MYVAGYNLGKGNPLFRKHGLGHYYYLTCINNYFCKFEKIKDSKR